MNLIVPHASHHPLSSCFHSLVSYRMRILQQSGQLRLLALQFRVATNVLLSNEDVGHRALVGHLFKSILDIGSVINLIQLNDVGLNAVLAQESLRGLAMRAVGLGEDSYCYS